MTMPTNSSTSMTPQPKEADEMKAWLKTEIASPSSVGSDAWQSGYQVAMEKVLARLTRTPLQDALAALHPNQPGDR
jgi:hypothetical protein